MQERVAAKGSGMTRKDREIGKLTKPSDCRDASQPVGGMQTKNGRLPRVVIPDCDIRLQHGRTWSGSPAGCGCFPSGTVCDHSFDSPPQSNFFPAGKYRCRRCLHRCSAKYGKEAGKRKRGDRRQGKEVRFLVRLVELAEAYRLHRVGLAPLDPPYTSAERG